MHMESTGSDIRSMASWLSSTPPFRMGIQGVRVVIGAPANAAAGRALVLANEIVAKAQKQGMIRPLFAGGHKNMSHSIPASW